MAAVVIDGYEPGTATSDVPPKRGRPAGSTNKTRAPARTSIQAGMTATHVSAGMLVSMFQPAIGGIIVQYAPLHGENWQRACDTNKWLREKAELFLSGSAVGELAVGYMMMLVAILAVTGKIPVPPQILATISGQEEPSNNGTEVPVNA